ncbi:pimeloyl-ACP methyl ester carboxylesterase [Pseudonocardia hierapolitana]|uniref:Pimeloyl-ACP methyl ester carboxylesterase n=1 Tax=Pseudonocardia hierapolitana TaxID=1128676 RepID=A0A561SKW2_9PSEU|nr:alpha/beta fold hydrolase [Pseudonocardia hierapolitana]TWF75505.1 pimeloyl-ACP methyl ester carboxylesterase [Pseudonocardia hierapolitana]
MPTVFVHGNPETAAVWDPLLAELEATGAARPGLIRLSPPGFGAPVPAGFGATVGEYRDWLIGELMRFAEPADLVGHDWGGGHVLNAVMSRPDLVRSWVSDAIGIFDTDYVWHELAQRWQTPGVGEADVAARFGAPVDERVATLVERGMSATVAEQVAPGQDAVMGRAVLALYRSAVQPVMAELGRDLERAAQRPGLVVLATADHVGGTAEQRRRAARRAGARVETLDGLGHWWMTRDPARGALALAGFWTSLDNG